MEDETSYAGPIGYQLPDNDTSGPFGFGEAVQPTENKVCICIFYTEILMEKSYSLFLWMKIIAIQLFDSQYLCRTFFLHWCKRK